MKSKNIIVPILVVLIVVIIVFTRQRSGETRSPVIPSTPSPTISTKLKECPDAWYKNMIPIIIDDPKEAEYAGEYFMVDNERRELSDYDVEWIVDNCEVNEPQPIY